MNEEQVEGADHVRVLGLDRLLAVGHRERRRGLLAVVDHGLGPGLDDHLLEEGRVLDRPDVGADLAAGDLVPGLDPLVELRIGVSESVPWRSCQRRREKLSTTETSWPRAEKRIAVGQPR